MKTANDIEVYIGFSVPKNHKFPIYSWLIKQVINKKFSHVYVRWKSKGADTQIVYHASGTSVHFLNGKKFREKVRPVVEFKRDIPREWYRDLLQVTMRKAGEDYGKRHAIAIGYSTLMRNYFSRHVANREQGWACSSIAALIMGSVFNEDLQLNPEKFDPGMIFDYCLADKDFTRHSEDWDKFDLEVKDYGKFIE